MDGDLASQPNDDHSKMPTEDSSVASTISTLKPWLSGSTTSIRNDSSKRRSMPALGGSAGVLPSFSTSAIRRAAASGVTKPGKSQQISSGDSLAPRSRKSLMRSLTSDHRRPSRDALRRRALATSFLPASFEWERAASIVEPMPAPPVSRARTWNLRPSHCALRPMAQSTVTCSTQLTPSGVAKGCEVSGAKKPVSMTMGVWWLPS
mmetsp:Transcript_110610/g.307528  ORF Transcript_110610/g.307528 Transcript_110610/m.307528 type:complete len:206 (+) Transcript_110610:187-804(+)